MDEQKVTHLLPIDALWGAAEVGSLYQVAPPVSRCPLEAMQESWEREELEIASRNRANASARRARAVKPWQSTTRR